MEMRKKLEAAGAKVTVKLLDAQSVKTINTRPQQSGEDDFIGSIFAPPESVWVDGASRFFPQFANEAELDDWLRRLITGGVT